MVRVRIATWNIKQIAPRRPLADRLRWLEENVGADATVLTEADLAVGRDVTDMAVEGRREGLSAKQRFSTFVISPTFDLERITSVGRVRRHELDAWYPGTLVPVDLMRDGRRWGTMVGVYGVTRDPDGTSHGHGLYSTERLLDDLEAITRHRDRVIVAGDLNIHPVHIGDAFEEVGLVDLIEATIGERDPLPGCVNCGLGSECGHLWTHKNGRADGNGRPQQIDYVFATEDLFTSLRDVFGGIDHFTDALDYSDHAPIVVDFDE